MQEDKKFLAFKMLVPHLRGALWWVRNDLIKERQSGFNPHDTHVGHPAVSILKSEPTIRYDAVPMLIGTSGGGYGNAKKQRCVAARGLVKNDPDHVTYFGGMIGPAMFDVDEMIDAVSGKGDVHVVAGKASKAEPQLVRDSWHVKHKMIPNHDKPMLDKSEMEALERFCKTKNL